MAKSNIKVRAKEDGGVVTVKALMNHPMETGLRKDKKTGEVIPAHFIQEVTIEVGGQLATKAYWNNSVSKNPYVSIKAKGKKGDTVKVSYVDNQGAAESAETPVG